ncbi:MAG: hypothetical protein KA419_07130 [Acidobacteria bacterium]|nr:hypothetical protein [Acidobacteriota bacterium]
MNDELVPVPSLLAWVTLDAFVTEFPNLFTKKQLEHFLFKNTRSFRDRCARRPGKKILLNVAEVGRWLAESEPRGARRSYRHRLEPNSLAQSIRGRRGR